LSWLKTDTLANIIELYTDLTSVISYIDRSDYLPFEDEGIVVTGLYQESDYPQYHGPDDRVTKMDFEATTQVIKGAVAAILHFARMNESAGVSITSNFESILVPNPANKTFKVISNDLSVIKVEVINALGQMVYSDNTLPNVPLSIRHLENGLYSVSISRADNAQKSYSKLIIAR